MTGYRVDPAGVNAVLGAVVASSQPIERAVAALQGDASSAAIGASSAIVGGALSDAFETLGAQLQEVRTRVPAVLQGTADAGRAVMEGDETMAQEIVGLATGSLSETDVLRREAHGRVVAQ